MWSLVLGLATSVLSLGQSDVPFPFDTAGDQDCRTMANGVISCVGRDPNEDVTVMAGWLVLGFWVLSVVLCLYAGRDMERRGQSGGLWGAVVLFGGLFGIVVWRLARKRLPVRSEAPAPPESPYGPGVRPGSLPWQDWPGSLP